MIQKCTTDERVQEDYDWWVLSRIFLKSDPKAPSIQTECSECSVWESWSRGQEETTSIRWSGPSGDVIEASCPREASIESWRVMRVSHRRSHVEYGWNQCNDAVWVLLRTMRFSGKLFAKLFAAANRIDGVDYTVVSDDDVSYVYIRCVGEVQMLLE